MFHRISKHLKFHQKYSTARHIFNSLLGVWTSWWNTISCVWYTTSKVTCTHMSVCVLNNKTTFWQSEKIEPPSHSEWCSTFIHEHICVTSSHCVNKLRSTVYMYSCQLSNKSIPIFPSFSPEIDSRRQINNLPSHKSVNRSSTWLLFCKNENSKFNYQKHIAGHNITELGPNGGVDLLPLASCVLGSVLLPQDPALHSCSVSLFSGVLMVAHKLSRQRIVYD